MQKDSTWLTKAGAAEIREERARVMTVLTGMAKRELSPEEQAQWDALTQQVADIDARLSAVEEWVANDPTDDAGADAVEPATNSRSIRANQLERLVAAGRRTRPAPVDAPAFVRDVNDARANRDARLALRGWVLGNSATNEHRAAAERTGMNLSDPILRVRLNANAEERDNSTSNTAGGYTIPVGFVAELEKKLALFNPLRNVARVIRTAEGNTLQIPTIDDTSNVAALGAENTAVTSVDMTYGQVSLGAYRYESLVICSNELLRDSGIDLASEIGSLLGERIGRAEAAAFATGTGSSQPQGVVTGSAAGVTAASATAIAVSDIIGLVNSVDAAYQINGAFMMHQSVWAAVLKLVDSQGRPLVADYINGNRYQLLGYPVIINNAMASSIATAAKTIVFGDFSKYVIREAGELELVRLNERFAEKYQTGFLCTGRRDGRVLQSAAIKRLTQA